MPRSSQLKLVAKLEQQCAERARQEELANCNCPEFKSEMPVVIFGSTGCEPETKQTCPVHGVRRFGDVIYIEFVDPDPEATYRGKLTEESARLPQLTETSDHLAADPQSRKEPEENE